MHNLGGQVLFTTHGLPVGQHTIKLVKRNGAFMLLDAFIVEQTSATPTNLQARVFNAGNVRDQPSPQGMIVDQINIGETVQLLARNATKFWYQITDVRGITGWVSATLLTIDPVTAGKVPTAGEVPTPPKPVPAGLQATAFNAGNLRDQPNVQGKVLDQIFAGETVQLLTRNAAKSWYRITDVRGVTGWASATLLTIDPVTTGQVPIDPASL